jgi:hypothetical protein
MRKHDMGRGSYPHYYAKKVPDDEWISQAAAARELGVSRLRVGLLIANDHLSAAEDSANRSGVSISSVAVEKRWRESAPSGARLKRLFLDVVGYF